jgi:hypothetical protein
MSFAQTAFSHAQMQLQATNKETTKQTFMAPEIKKTPAIMTPSGGINNTKSERRTLVSSTYLLNGIMCNTQDTSIPSVHICITLTKTGITRSA